MPIVRRDARFRTLSAAELESWQRTSSAVVGDAQNRSQCMGAAIKPLRAGARVLGQARTVETMVGDNSAAHAALALIGPGQVLVVDARGHTDTAVFGEVMAVAAQARAVAGVVLDGAVRDVARLREMALPVFARAAVPRGPHKGYGGTIDGPVTVGGVLVCSGDLVVGDDDGVAVVPLASVAMVLEEVRRIEAREAAMLVALAAGKTSAELVGVTVPDIARG